LSRRLAAELADHPLPGEEACLSQRALSLAQLVGGIGCLGRSGFGSQAGVA